MEQKPTVVVVDGTSATAARMLMGFQSTPHVAILPTGQPQDVRLMCAEAIDPSYDRSHNPLADCNNIQARQARPFGSVQAVNCPCNYCQGRDRTIFVGKCSCRDADLGTSARAEAIWKLFSAFGPIVTLRPRQNWRTFEVR